MLFADLLSLHLVTFFIPVHVPLFFSSRCIELKFAIYHRAASLPSQASLVLGDTKIEWKKIFLPQALSAGTIFRLHACGIDADCACVSINYGRLATPWRHARPQYSQAGHDILTIFTGIDIIAQH